MSGSGTAQRSIAITDEATLKSGDEIKMFVSPVSRCLVYVLHQGPDRRVRFAVPVEARFDNVPMPAGSTHYIRASATERLELDDSTGLERVYLIASTTKLSGLKRLLTANESAAPAAKASADRQLIAKIARLRGVCREARGKAPFAIRVGHNTGVVTVGNMGSTRRLSYTVLGADVNLTQRLESNAPVGGILIAGDTAESNRSTIAAEARGAIPINRVDVPIPVFEVSTGGS